MFEIGKLPPLDIEVEASIISSIIMNSNYYHLVSSLIRAEYFYNENNKALFSVIKKMMDNNDPLDLITISSKAKQLGELENIGGIHYISTLATKFFHYNPDVLVYNAKILAELYIKRQFIGVGHNIAQMAYSDSKTSEDIITAVSREIDSANKIYLGGKTSPSLEEILSSTVKQIENIKSEGLAGIRTGNSKIDKLLGGWMNGELTIIAARPGMGKTARVLSHIKAAAQEGKKILFFSLEMTSQSLVKRLISENASIENYKLRTGDLHLSEWSRINAAVNDISEYDIHIEDKSSISINDIKALSKMRKMTHGIDLIVVDYLQIIQPDDKKLIREQQISEIARGLKSLAKDLNLPIIALAQLSREVDKRSDKRPIVSDLRESGAIEQEADIIIGLYRPSYYYDYDNDPDVKANSVNWDRDTYFQVSEYIPLKFRDGDTTKMVTEYFHGIYSRYEEGSGNEFYNTNIQPSNDSNDDIF